MFGSGPERVVVRRARSAAVAVHLLLPALAAAEEPAPPPEQIATPPAPQDPKVLLDQGAKAMKAKQYAEACAAFDEANKVDPKVATQLKLADCREKNQQLASALAAYKAAQPNATTAKDFKLIKARIAALEPKVSTIRLMIPDASMLEGLAVARDGVAIDDTLWNTDIPVDGGTYKIDVTAPAHVAWSESATVVNEGEHLTVRVPVLEAVPPPPPPEPAPQPPEPPPPPPPPVVVPPPVVTEPSLMVKWTTITPRRKIALGVAGAGVVGIGIAIGLGVSANGRYDDARALCPDVEYPCADAAEATELNDSARSRALGANILWAVGGAAIIGAGVLWYLGMPESSSGIAIAPTITNRDATLAIMGSF